MCIPGACVRGWLCTGPSHPGFGNYSYESPGRFFVHISGKDEIRKSTKFLEKKKRELNLGNRQRFSLR